MNKIKSGLIASVLVAAQAPALAVELNDKCVINILNRTVQVSADGNWALPNVPSNMGQIRARATCMLDDGTLVFGQSDYFTVEQNGISRAGDIKFVELDPIPTRLSFTSTNTLRLGSDTPTHQLAVTAYYADDSVKNVTQASSGINYSSTNSDIAEVTVDGLITAKTNGSVLVNARKDGVLVSRQVTVLMGGDQDGDGLPDDWERANGLNPSDPIDALEDHDKDGLTAKQEFDLGTDIHNADTDGDGISDLEESTLGEDGFITSPILADSDGDGIADGLEIAGGSDPNDSSSGNINDFLESIDVQPTSLLLTYNQIDGESSGSLTVTGTMIDGSTLDLTDQSTGTRYSTSDVRVANFGINDGEVFAGQSGNAQVTITNSGQSYVLDVTVNEFAPVSQSALTLPGYGNNLDKQGDYVYVASGSAGLQVVDVSNKTAPQIVASLDTSGIAVDVKVLGNYAYLADGLPGLRIIDISNPLAPVVINTKNTGGFAMDVVLKDDLAFVADDIGGFEIFNIANPAKAFSVGQSSEFPIVSGLDVEGDHLVAVGGSALALFDIENPNNPILLQVVNIGAVRDVVIDKGYIYVAAKSSGYRVYKVTTGNTLELVGGDRSFIPYDVTVTDGFAFFADLLFNNVIAVLNAKVPDAPVFQDIIDFFAFGDYAGTGVVVDATHAFMVAEHFSISSDYGDTGDTKLFGAQYRDISDVNGIAPQVSLLQPVASDVYAEGNRLILAADAIDDIAVQKVEFFSNGSKVGEVNSAPYRIPFTAPIGVSAMAITATATDLGGNTSTSAIVTIEVQKDNDGDGLGNEQETNTYGTKFDNPDSDEDGVDDGAEIARGTNPNNPDSDGDGINDGEEVSAGTDPNNPDITAPSVIATTPQNGEVEVAENSAIVIEFSEVLKRKSISIDAITVTDVNNNPVAGNIRLIGDGSQLSFQATELLTEFSTYNVTVSHKVRDLAGNVMEAPVSFSFETGDTVDTERPTIVDVAPVNNSLDVPVNVLVTVRMSERLARDTINGDSFYITDTTTNTRIDGFVEVQDDDQTITFRPNQAFLVGRRHSISIKNTITDLSANSLSGNSTYYFTTAFAADGVAPTIVRSSFPANATQVPLNAGISVELSEMINPSTVKNVVLLKNGEAIDTNISLTNGGTIIKVQPQSVMEPSTAYTLLVDGLEDLSGNLLAEPLNLDFVTGDLSDTSAGSLVHYSPRNHAEVSANTIFTAEYSEPVDFTSVNSSSFRVYDETEGRDVKGVYSIDTSLTKLYFTADELKEGHRYWVYYSYIKNLAGYNFPAKGYYYATVVTSSDDNAAPEIITGNIVDGATNVALNSSVKLAFNEPVGSQCVNNDTVKLMLNGEEVATTISVSSDGKLVTITPASELAASGQYQVVVDGVCDYAGNILQSYTSSFTTGTAVDTTRPAVVEMSPANNATEISVNTPIVMTFSEAIDPTNTYDQIQIYVSGVSGYVAGEFDFSGNIVTFTPKDPLPGNSQINIYLYGYRDIAGNSDCCRHYKFFTESVFDSQGPQVAAITPADGAMDVGVRTPIVITFNESLNAATINNTNFKLYNDGNLITPSVTRSPDSRTVTLRGTWPAGTPMSVLVTNEVKDLSNNPMVDYASVFTTAVVDNDTARPSVSRQYPVSGATNVKNLDRISLYTSEVMNEASIADAFHVAENGILVSGDISLEGQGQAITFTPSRPFAPGALVNVYLDSTATDDSGNAMSHYQGNFTMATDSVVGTRPAALTYIPTNGSVDVPVNGSIQVLYNQDIDEVFVNESYINLRQDGGELVTSNISLSTDKRIVSITPVTDLLPNTYYYVSMSGNLQDVDGETQYYNRSFGFTTRDSATVDSQQPMVLAMSPGNNAIDVALNPLYHVRFDEPINPLSVELEQSMSVAISADNQSLTYQRFAPLAANTTYNETPVAVKDMAGLAAIEHVETFTTGSEVDVVVPNYASYSPAYNSTVAINTPVVWTMNEAIDPLTVNDSTVYVQDVTAGWPVVAGSASLASDGITITWVPDVVLPVGRRYYAYLGGVTDLSGNANRGDGFYFYTNTQVDTQSPSLHLTSVIDGMIDIPLNSRIRVRFDEVIDSEFLSGITLEYNGQVHPLRYEMTSDRHEVILVPISLLPSQTQVTLNVTGVKDLTGNNAPSSSLTFTTEVSIDTQAGSLISINPANHTETTTNTVISAHYSERVDFVSVDGGTYNFQVYNETQGRHVPGSYSISDDRTVLSFQPDSEYVLGDRYWVYLSGFRDLAGNSISARGYYYFTPTKGTDNTAPAQINSNISAGMIDVALNTAVKLQFNEQLGAHCVNNNTVKLMLNGLEVDATVSLNASRTQLTINASTDLAANSSYEVVIDGLCDVSGNQLTGFTHSFSTGSSADTTRPSLTAITPANNSTDVSVNTPIVMTFSEVIDPTNTIEQIQVYVSGVSGYVAGQFDFSVSSGVSVVTFTPDTPLPGNSQINVYLYGYRDVAGNSDCCRHYKFHTGATLDTLGPQVVSITPNDGAMGIGHRTPVVVTFNESLNADTVNSTNFKLYHDGGVITPSVSRSLDSKTVTLRGTWPSGAAMSVFITNQVKDLSNNPMADFASTFSTAVIDNDNVRPSVVRQYPNSGATNVQGITSVTLYMNDAMNASTISDGLTIVQDGVIKTGSIELTDNSQGITYTPDTPFAEGSLVHVYLSIDALDDSGNPANAYQGNFTMGYVNNPGTRPTQLTYIPSNGATDVAVNDTIQIAYSQDINEAFVNENYINLRVDGGDIVPSTISLSANKRIVTIKPDTDLAISTYYYVSMSGSVEDINGDAQYYNRSFSFTTSDSSAQDTQQPMVIAMSPSNNAQNVALNPRFHVRFDEAINPLSVQTQQNISLSFSSDNKTMTYVKYQPLNENTAYSEAPLGADDMAGNSVVNYTANFTTGSEADITAPNYVTYTPDYNHTVATNPPVVWKMDEPIDPLSVNDSVVYVQDVTAGWPVVAGSASLEADGKTITWMADAPLAVGRRFYAYLGGVTDLSGNSNSGDGFYFYANTEADTQAPSVVLTSVFEGLTDVPLNSRIRVLFDEAVDKTKLDGLTISYDGSTHEVDYLISADRKEVTIVPMRLLPSQTSITLSIAGIADLNGNEITSSSLTFTTQSSIDTQAGALVSINPANHSEVATNAIITAVYSERVDFTSVNGTGYHFQVYNETQGRHVPGTYQISDDGTAVSFHVEGEFALGDRHWVYLSGFRDIAGNGISARGYYYFTPVATADNTAPAAINSNIFDGQTAVALNSPIKLHFDEQLALQCVNGDSIKLVQDGVQVEAAVSIDGSRKNITITPATQLAANTSYQVVVDGLCDTSGNSVINYSSTFTTSSSVDTTKPALVSLSPENGSTNVGVNTPIVMTFSEVIDPTNTIEQIQVYVSGVSGYVAGDFDFAASSGVSIVTFTPHSPLPGNSEINIYLYGYRDVVGNSDCCRHYKFTTENVVDSLGPQVLSITPADGAMDIGVRVPVVINFDESLNAATVNNTNFKLYANGGLITPSVSRSLDSRTVTLRATWPAGQTVSVLMSDGITDLSNNPMNDTVSVFTTAMVDTDSTRPLVARMYPVSGASNVSVDSKINLYFSESMNGASLNDALVVAQDGVIKSGSIALTPNSQGLTFTPDTPFSEGAWIHVYLDSSAKDDSGNALTAYQGNFSIAKTSTIGTRPTQISYMPVNGSENVAISNQIQIGYNQPLNAEFVNENYFSLKLVDNTVVPAQYSLSADKKVVTLTPDAPLTANTYYSVSMSADIEDIDAERQYHNRSFSFTTGNSGEPDQQQPTITGMSPPAGSVDVALNPQYTVQYDEPFNPLSIAMGNQAQHDMTVWLSADNRQLQYVRHMPLPSNAAHTEFAISVTDVSGNEALSHSTTFTTGETLDTVAPNYMGYLPVYNSTVATSAKVHWEMTEVIDPLSLNADTVYVVDTSISSWPKVAGTASLSADSKNIIWTPETPLSPSRRYRAYIAGVTDLSGNVNSSDAFYFYTGADTDNTAPQVTKSSVENGATDVAVDTAITITFDETVNYQQLTGVTLSVMEGSDSVSVPMRLETNSDATQITVVPVNPLQANKQTTVTLSGVKDLSDNTMANQSITFTTGLGH